MVACGEGQEPRFEPSHRMIVEFDDSRHREVSIGERACLMIHVLTYTAV
jgi:hypothetical protein